MTTSSDTNDPCGDGPRSLKLRDVFRRALKNTLDSCSVEALAEALPGARHQTLQTAQRQLVDFLSDSAQKEFDLIAQQRDIYAKLNALDRALVGSSSSPSTATASPPLAPADLVRAATTPIKRAHLAQLQEQLTRLRSQNKELAQQLQPQRDQCRSLLGSLRQSLVTLEETSTAAGSIHKHDVWTILQTLETDQIPQPLKRPHAESMATVTTTTTTTAPSASATIARTLSVEYETNTSPVKKRR